ncbi:MAG TPA: M50 family metallopeptidase [Candidatus Omnitrophota bacterium]|nr:RIP metalloprotease RseP [Candidatus Omnitrophota bacterium]HRK62022.1 M50 family metallopeptidase [Candidatus Omnitrophota bacterium]
MLSWIPGLVLFGVLIAIHELGHFLACRLTKVKVDKFSIGFGPEILKWKGKETTYTLSLLPLGGFVKPAGEQISEVEGGQPQPGDYLAAPVSARIFIVCAGVIMNYLLALALLIIFFAAPHSVPANVIGEIQKDSPAAAAGLLKGDRILSVDGKPVKVFSEIKEAIVASSADLKLSIERKDESGFLSASEVVVQPQTVERHDIFGKKTTDRVIGFLPDGSVAVREQYGLGEAITKAAVFEWNYVVLTHKAIFYLVTGQMSPKNLAGPVGIVKMSGEAAKQGWTQLIFLAAILSIGLGVFNLLPFPALDGGHLVFLLVEAITKKPASLKIQERAATVGFILLMGLMVVVFYNDLVNLSIFEKIKNLFNK